jgi:DNA-binding Lrp family transcriptional regulator
MLDSTDKRLLGAVQNSAQLTAQELGDMLHLSASQAGRRRQRLETEGYIKSVSARLDAKKLGLNVQAFVQVSLSVHNQDRARAFHALVRARSEVVSVWTLTGEADYLLRVYCHDLAALNSLVHDVFLPHDAVARVQSRIVMDQIKADAPLPV